VINCRNLIPLSSINHAEISVVFSTENHVQALLDLSAKCPSLKMIVSFETLEDTKKSGYVATGKEKGIEVLDLKECKSHPTCNQTKKLTFLVVEAIGSAKLVDPIPATLDQVSNICYTSGTTNTPKGELSFPLFPFCSNGLFGLLTACTHLGVILTHRNLASAAISNLHGLDLPPNPVYFSYLPLAHIYGRVGELIMMAIGGQIGFFTGNPLNLLSDVQALKPHFFPSGENC
jgi:long-chain acyl-CoA synthetase